ncbi:MAG: hypothetical protein ACXAD7_26250 [Candidatus Kariarchaeaceae archaeon]
MEQALLIAEERNLKHLEDKIKSERNLMEKEMDRWKEMLQKGKSLQERIERSRILEYVEFAKNYAATRKD